MSGEKDKATWSSTERTFSLSLPFTLISVHNKLATTIGSGYEITGKTKGDRYVITITSPDEAIDLKAMKAMASKALAHYADLVPE